MKKTYIIPAIILLLTFVSCQNKMTLQKYFVEKSESLDFISFDISAGILNIATENLKPDEKKAVESIKKLNILAFKQKEGKETLYETELKTVNEILQDDEYVELMQAYKGSDGGSVYYIGEDDAIDEFILFGNMKENGFIIVRVLGNDMSPEMVMPLISAMKNANIDNDALKPLESLVK
uniref:DUF4252 domain-containing protein n=1 Tax=Flavobacterium sp. TaxID=239 RepID=UPI0040493095